MGSLDSVVLLDASVLFPVSLCDLLLRCAEAKLYRPRWSQEILEELRRNLRPRIGTEQADRRIAAMMRAFRYASVTGYESLIGAMGNHPKDRHVLAAAVSAGAQIIVTFNLRDFPASVLAPLGVEAQHPDRFLNDLLDDVPERLRDIVVDQAAELRHPPATVEDVLGALTAHVPVCVGRLRALT